MAQTSTESYVELPEHLAELARDDGLPADQTRSLLRAPTDAEATPFDWTSTACDVSTLPALSVAEAPSDVLPDYRLDETLGEGGMGVVYLARQEALQRQVAVKRLKPERASEQARRALLREALLTGALEHPCIVPVHALGRVGEDEPLLVMKRVEGVTWRTLMRDPEHPAWQVESGDRLARHLEILCQVALAVHFAHSRGVVHRDIKPANVMVGDFGEVYVLDWGIASHVGPRPESGKALVGTPAYMAPEMARGNGEIAPHTDVYLLGACLHEVLTGTPRHTGPDLCSVLASVVLSEPYDYGDGTAEELAQICNRACARNPADRYPSALAMRDAVKAYLRHRGSIALAESASARLAELERLLNDEGAEVGARVRRFAAECRFGFTHALKTWPDNPRAVKGLHRTAEALLELELRERNLGAAESLLEELAEPRPDLAARVRALREEVSRLHAMARDADSRVSAGQRTKLLIAGILATILPAGGFVVGRSVGWFAPTHLTNVVFSLALVPLLTLGLVLGRRSLLATRFNRTLSLLIVGFAYFQAVNRGLGAYFGIPVDYVLVGDIFYL
ncbi:MAG: serine/threonine-protein kinase, partial [Myxococcota bacterium]